MIDLRIDGYTQVYALLGERLGHTWSPPIHNSLFQTTGQNAVYIAMPILPGDIPSALSLLGGAIQGYNVTIPYKQAVIPYLHKLTEDAQACGAVNTIKVLEEGSFVGHNTDGAGFLRALRELFLDLEGVSVIVLGSGGTARMAAYNLCKEGARVMLAARNLDAARAAAREIGEITGARIGVTPLQGLSGGADLLVNTTPVGMHPLTDASPVEEDLVRRCGAVFDAIYNPWETTLLWYARKNRVKAVNGLGMLFYQAVEAQRIWGMKIPAKKVLDEIFEGISGTIQRR